MKITVNGAWHDLAAPAAPAAPAASAAAPTLEAVLEQLGFAERIVATALNGEFVAADARERTVVCEGDRVEVVAPMQGG